MTKIGPSFFCNLSNVKGWLEIFPHCCIVLSERKCGSDSNLGEFNLNDHDEGMGDGGDEAEA